MYPTFVIILVAFTKTYTEPSMTRIVALGPITQTALRGHYPPITSLMDTTTVAHPNASSISVIHVYGDVEVQSSLKAVEDLGTCAKNTLSDDHGVGSV